MAQGRMNWAPNGKVNVVAQLKFEFTYYNVAVEPFIRYIIKTQQDN